MNVTIASIFRDSAAYLDRYIAQVAGLRDMLAHRGDTLRAVWGEGDSNDRTAVILAEQARKRALAFDLLDVSHGGPKFGSVNVEQRWRQISYCCNTVLDNVPVDADVVVYIESDLIWDVETIINLLDRLTGSRLDAIAPMSMAYGENRPRFYDTYGHASGGVNFQPYAPFHKDLQPGKLLQLDSAGSCIVMRGYVTGQVRFDPPDAGIVGFGHDLNAKGFTLWLDPSQSVWHP